MGHTQQELKSIAQGLLADCKDYAHLGGCLMMVVAYDNTVWLSYMEESEVSLNNATLIERVL